MADRGYAPATRWVVVLGLVAGAASAREWQLVNPLPTAADLHGVACGPPGCVAVGEGGAILTSPDGVGWEVVSSPTTSDLAAVTWSGSAYVAVGAGGTVLTSPDGETWTLRESGTAAGLEGVCAGPAGLLVTVGEAGTILTSTDAATWRGQESGTEVTLRDVTWAGSALVTVGDAVDRHGTVLTSADAVHWAPAQGETWGDLLAVTAEGSLVVIGSDGSLMARGELVGGELVVEPNGSEVGPVAGLAWCGDRFVGVGDWGGQWSSSDGAFWDETPTTDQHLSLRTVACAPAGLIAVGLGGQIAASPDGAHWRRESGIVEQPLRVAGNGERLVAVTRQDPCGWSWAPPLELTSDDGARWAGPAPMPVDGFDPTGLAYGRGRFVAVGSRGYSRAERAGVARGGRDLALRRGSGARARALGHGPRRPRVGQPVRGGDDGGRSPARRERRRARRAGGSAPAPGETGCCCRRSRCRRSEGDQP